MPQKIYEILIVDHQTNRRDNLSSRLRTQGYSIDTAAEGFQALSFIESKDYHLMLVIEDLIDMPNIELFSLVRVTSSKEDLPILFLTADISTNNIMAAIEAGANDVIERNDDLNYLFRKIKEMVS